jgi:ABC-type glycerol-3-phosphate transport system substrate-binding protein
MQRTWQRVIVLIAGIAMVACSGGGSPPQPTVTITFQHQFGDAESAKFDQLVTQFEAQNPNIQIKTVRDNASSYYDKLVTTILGGSAPDIARVEPPKAAQYIASGYAAPVDQYVSSSERSQFFPGTVEPLIKGGKLYGVPQDVATLVLYYRTDMFQAAGIAAPPKTWDELLADAQQLTKAPNQYGLGLFGGWGAFEFYPWLWQAGGQMLQQQSGKNVPVFNSPEGVKALQFWTDLERKYKVMPPGAATLTEDDLKGPFIAGKLAMFTSGPWIVGTLKSAGIDGKWSAAPLPRDAQQASVLGGMDLIVLNQSQHKAEAGKFLSWLMQDSVQSDWATSLKFIPIKQSMYSSAQFSSDPLNATFLAALKVSRSRPTIPQAGEVDNDFGQAVQAALSGAMTPQAALDSAAQKAQTALAQ